MQDAVHFLQNVMNISSFNVTLNADASAACPINDITGSFSWHVHPVLKSRIVISNLCCISLCCYCYICFRLNAGKVQRSTESRSKAGTVQRPECRMLVVMWKFTFISLDYKAFTCNVLYNIMTI